MKDNKQFPITTITSPSGEMQRFVGRGNVIVALRRLKICALRDTAVMDEELNAMLDELETQ